MSKVIEKTLLIKPMSVNSFYRTFQNRILISKDGRIYKKQVLELLGNDFQKILGRVKLTLHFYFKDRRKVDLDNPTKPICDIFKDVLFEDDDQIYKLELKKFIGTGEDKTYLKIEELNEEENKEIDNLLEKGEKIKKEKAKAKREADKFKKKLETKNEDDKIEKLEKPKKIKLSKIEKQLNI
jgi:Holliday junction resolvase RusA-like endonuclease